MEHIFIIKRDSDIIYETCSKTEKECWTRARRFFNAFAFLKQSSLQLNHTMKNLGWKCVKFIEVKD